MKTPIVTLVFLFFISSCGFNTDTDNSSDAHKPTETAISIEKSAFPKKEASAPIQKQPISKNQTIEQESVNSADIADDQIRQSPNSDKASTSYKAKKLHRSTENPAIKPIITEEDDMPRLD